MQGIHLEQRVRIEETLTRGSWANCKVSLQKSHSRRKSIKLHLKVKPICAQNENYIQNEGVQSETSLNVQHIDQALTTNTPVDLSSLHLLADVAEVYALMTSREYLPFPLLVCNYPDDTEANNDP